MSPTAGCNPKPDIVSSPAERLAAQLDVHVAPRGCRRRGPPQRSPDPVAPPGTHRRKRARARRPCPRAKALTIARWIIRSFPQAGWAASGGHAFDLRTAQLRGLGSMMSAVAPANVGPAAFEPTELQGLAAVINLLAQAYGHRRTANQPDVRTSR